MKVLVTGAGGFLGSRVVTELLERGHSVRAMLRPASSGTPSEWRGRAEIVRADLRSPGTLEKLFDQVDVLIHLAATVRGTPEARFAGTVVGTEKLLEAMRRSPSTRHLVLAGSFAVYDWTAAKGRLTEESGLESKPYERDGYTVAKVWQERVVRRLAEENAWTLTVLRPGFIYGPGGPEVSGAGVDLKKFFLVIGPFNRLPVTHVENCARAFADAAEKGIAGVFNIIDDERISAWQYANRFCQNSGKRFLLPIPYTVGLAIAYMAQMTSRLLFPPKGGKLPGLLKPRWFHSRFKPLGFDSRKAKESLGWTCRPLFAEGASVI